MKIRKISILLAAASLLAFMACDRTDPYKGGDVFASGDGAFVSFDFLGGLTIKEDAGTYKVPIRVLGKHPSAFSITISTDDGTAINGQDFSIAEPVTGVLSFEPQDSIKYVVLNIARGEIGDYAEPGYKDFTLKIGSSTGGVEIGAARSAVATINDADHPLADIIGAYTATADDYFSGNVSWTFKILAKEGDLESIIIDGITSSFQGAIDPDGAYDYSYTAKVNGVEGSRVFSIPFGKEMKSDVNGNIVSLWGFDGQYVYANGDLVFEQQSDGSFTVGEWGFGIGYRAASGGISLYDLIKPETFSMVPQD